MRATIESSQMRGAALLLPLLFLAACIARAEEPPLPSGLTSEEPALPSGLGAPAGSEGERRETDSDRRLPFDLSGFWEARFGTRLQHDPYEKHISLGETRLQIELQRMLQSAQLTIKGDFLLDPVLDKYKVNLEEGHGWFDLREANASFRPMDFMDLKIGRQVATWGVGDLLFINDLFPKDWNSFFIGRDEQYLKAPSDAVKVSLFSSVANLDVVYTPRFDSDRYIDGRRISYFNSMLGRRAGRGTPVEAHRRDDWFTEDEIALRIFRNIGGAELALYAYDGFWKSPGGINPTTGKAIFPRLAAYGASVRGTVGKGIGSLEVGYYDSRDDRDGDDPFVRNSEFRFLVGYEQELARDFTGGVQYYLEHMMDHGDYRRSLPAGSPRADEDRHVFTIRLTRLLMSQNLRLSMFAYYSPSDNDSYLRPNVHYKVSDRWAVEAGGNVFIGEKPHTFFGQFERNTNAYVATRYSF